MGKEAPSKLSVPENWERIDELSTKDFSVYAGANDWESTWSAVAFIFGSHDIRSHYTKRVWGHIKLTEEEMEGKQGTDRGESVVKEWIKLAKAEKQKRDSSSWQEQDLMKAAKQMGDKLSGFGLETVEWKAAKVVEAVLEGHGEAGTPPDVTTRLHSKMQRGRSYLQRHNPAELAVMGLEAGMDDSHGSMEGHPPQHPMSFEGGKAPKSPAEARAAGTNWYLKQGSKVYLNPQVNNRMPFQNSVTMSRNRNIRRKSFGYPDHAYSMRDRGWPTGQRRRKAEKLVGVMLDQGANI